jgi:hypothetical protein
MAVEALPIQMIVAVVIPAFQVVTAVAAVTSAPNKTINNIRYAHWEKVSLSLRFFR